jgi:hypothetical protein
VNTIIAVDWNVELEILLGSIAPHSDLLAPA